MLIKRLGHVYRGWDMHTEAGMCIHMLLRTHCFYLSSGSYQGIVGGLGHNDAKGDLEGLEGQGESTLKA
jgi:hypothetical protein